jgi:hypothetical protein
MGVSGMERWNGTMERIGMEWNNGMTTPTERGFVATYTLCTLPLSQQTGQNGRLSQG